MSTFIYTRDIPDGPHNPSVDQGPMKVNTNSIDDIINVDHYSFGESNKDGWHRQCTFPVQTAPTTASGQAAIYSKTGVSGTQLYMIRDNNAGTEIALTTSKFGAPVANTNGRTFLAGPATGAAIGAMVIQWNAVTGLGGAWPTTPQTVTFSEPFVNNCYNVQVTFIGPTSSSTGDICINSVSNTAFTWQFTGSASASFGGFYWLAIGN